MHWTEVVRRRHAAAQQALVRSIPSISVPIGDSPYTAPGWIYEGLWWSAYPDAVYPWDPSVIAFLREIQPDVIPLTMTAVYRWSNYNELGHLGEPVIIRRHAIGRYIRDPISRVFDFPVTMPSVGFHQKPNFIETIWHADDTRPYGKGVPYGDYLPLDWEAAYSIKNYYDHRARTLAASRSDIDEAGDTVAVGSASSLIKAHKSAKQRKEQARIDEAAYVRRDLESFYCVEPSDVEWKEAMLGEPEPEHKLVMTVPAMPVAPAASISPAVSDS